MVDLVRFIHEMAEAREREKEARLFEERLDQEHVQPQPAPEEELSDRYELPPPKPQPKKRPWAGMEPPG
ncbi:MAG: hypothetical protein AB7E52_04895, partial [Bdellovibrionales bacterium]